MAGEQRPLDLGEDGLVEAEDAGEALLAGLQPGEEVVPDLGLDGPVDMAAVAQGTRVVGKGAAACDVAGLAELTRSTLRPDLGPPHPAQAAVRSDRGRVSETRPAWHARSADSAVGVEGSVRVTDPTAAMALRRRARGGRDLRRPTAAAAAVDARRPGAAGQAPDLLAVFVCGPIRTPTLDRGRLARAGAARRRRTSSAAQRLGVCGAGQAVLGDVPAVSVWAAVLPGDAAAGLPPRGDASRRRARRRRHAGPRAGRAGRPAASPIPTAFRCDSFVDRFNEALPGLALLGGLAAGPAGAGSTRLFLDGRRSTAAPSACCSAAVSSDGGGQPGLPADRARTWWSRGPTATSLLELAGVPALSKLRERAGRADRRGPGTLRRRPADRPRDGRVRRGARARRLPGPCRSSASTRRARPSPSARWWRSAAPSASTSGTRPRPAPTCAPGWRSAAGRAGALLICCNGRGPGMFGRAESTSSWSAELPRRPPVAGFFGGGELGPVGGRNYLHGSPRRCSRSCERRSGRAGASRCSPSTSAAPRWPPRLVDADGTVPRRRRQVPTAARSDGGAGRAGRRRARRGRTDRAGRRGRRRLRRPDALAGGRRQPAEHPDLARVPAAGLAARAAARRAGAGAQRRALPSPSAENWRGAGPGARRARHGGQHRRRRRPRARRPAPRRRHRQRRPHRPRRRRAGRPALRLRRPRLPGGGRPRAGDGRLGRGARLRRRATAGSSSRPPGPATRWRMAAFDRAGPAVGPRRGRRGGAARPRPRGHRRRAVGAGELLFGPLQREFAAHARLDFTRDPGARAGARARTPGCSARPRWCWPAIGTGRRLSAAQRAGRRGSRRPPRRPVPGARAAAGGPASATGTHAAAISRGEPPAVRRREQPVVGSPQSTRVGGGGLRTSSRRLAPGPAGRRPGRRAAAPCPVPRAQRRDVAVELAVRRRSEQRAATWRRPRRPACAAW